MTRLASDLAGNGRNPLAPTDCRSTVRIPIYPWLVSPETLAPRIHRRDRAGRDRRLDAVAWRDLVPLTRPEIALELVIWTPWLAASLLLAGHGLFVAALPCSFLFFLTALRLIHDAQHANLGIGRLGHDLVLFATSILMLGSNHAVRVVHLRHHQDCLGAADVEGLQARLPAWQTILLGPLYPVMLNWAALRDASSSARRWIAAELAANLGWIAAVLWLIGAPALVYHVAVMGLAQCLTAFFCVWTIHHASDAAPFPARTLDGRWANLATCNLFLHVEHHLFPAVPTAHLRSLSARLAEAAPEYRKLKVM